MPKNTPKSSGRPASAETPSSDSPTLLRINRALAMAGVCSRRAADELVASGAVRVNGQPADQPGLRIDPATDVVEVNGSPVSIPVPGQEEHVYLVMNKPVEVVTTARDPQGRRTVLDLLPTAQRGRRVFPVGRLDYYSQGLLLLTTDGELTNRLTHPRWHLPKVYNVRVRGGVTEDKLDVMRKGMTLAEGERLAPVPVEASRDGGEGILLTMTLIQGVNRQIRRMCRDLGLTILRLERIAQGPVRLGRLPKGKARELTHAERTALLTAVDMPAPAPAQGGAPAGTPSPQNPGHGGKQGAGPRGGKPRRTSGDSRPYGDAPRGGKGRPAGPRSGRPNTENRRGADRPGDSGGGRPRGGRPTRPGKGKRSGER